MLLKQIGSKLFRVAKHQQLAATIRPYSSKYDGLVVEPKNQILWIRFNRPEKLNAINGAMYTQIMETLKEANSDKSIKAAVLTGTGDYYSSGNDLSDFLRSLQTEPNPKAVFNKFKDVMVDFVDSLINFEKFLIAAVNGPAIGIPVTTLPLCDYVIASDKAIFQTPFTALGQCPEACSSLTFPKILGPSKASELLSLNMTWDAKKAHANGLVADVIEHEKFYPHLDELLYGKRGIVSTCYPNSLRITKSLSRDPATKRELLATNRREADEIVDCWTGEECADALAKFSKRSK